MKTVLIIVQIVLALVLTTLIFLQSSGSDESRSNIISAVNFEKRGWEKVMFNLTIVILILFLISSVIQIIV
ncbi:MAG: preprotein translocase subunit SecG [Candidatus Shapirobacteria bacterium]|nr:preprotein translocase subunit SecG [Candidatus Shapirobacteria bacterium]